MAKYASTTHTCECGEKMELEPCQSAAGWYAGFFCPCCGPYDRITDYLPTEEHAQVFVDAYKRNGFSFTSYWEV